MMALRLLIPQKTRRQRLSNFCLRLLSSYLAGVKAEDRLSSAIRYGWEDNVFFFVFSPFTRYRTQEHTKEDMSCIFVFFVLYQIQKTKTRHCTKDCLCLLSLSSSLLAMIKPFLKLPSFDLQMPLDNSLGGSLFCRHFADKLFSTQGHRVAQPDINWGLDIPALDLVNCSQKGGKRLVQQPTASLSLVNFTRKRSLVQVQYRPPQI